MGEQFAATVGRYYLHAVVIVSYPYIAFTVLAYRADRHIFEFYRCLTPLFLCDVVAVGAPYAVYPCTCVAVDKYGVVGENISCIRNADRIAQLVRQIVDYVHKAVVARSESYSVLACSRYVGDSGSFRGQLENMPGLVVLRTAV